MEGWVSIHRKLSENPLWTCEPFSRGQAWIDLILLAAHKRHYFYKRGVKVEVDRGSLAWSEKALSARWKWSRSKVRKFLKDMEKEHQIDLQKSNVTQIVTIKNYDKYQQKEPQDEQQKDRRRTAEEPQKDTNNNDNNEYNEEQSFEAPQRVNEQPPSKAQVLEFFQLRSQSSIEANQFFDYWQASNWQNNLGANVNWQQKAISWISRVDKKKQEAQVNDPYKKQQLKY